MGDRAAGRVDVRLLAGSLRGCAFLGDATEVGLCAKILAGQLRAAGAGFSVDGASGRPWFAIEPDAFVDRALLRGLRVRASAGVAIPVHAEAFYVSGASRAFDTPAVGGVFSVSLELATP